jgi:hypothetical protein
MCLGLIYFDIPLSGTVTWDVFKLDDAQEPEKLCMWNRNMGCI